MQVELIGDDAETARRVIERSHRNRDRKLREILEQLYSQARTPAEIQTLAQEGLKVLGCPL